MSEKEFAVVEEASPAEAKADDLVAAFASAKRSRTKKVAIVASVVVVVAAIIVFALFAAGILSPGNTAAKYDLMSYVSEDEVTEYIENYRTQVGIAADDEASWAEYLASNNMTPASLRVATIRQLIIDREMEKRASKLGISVSDEELQSSIDALKDSMAFGDDETWKQTLELYGQTEEGLEDTYRRSLLQKKLFEEDVPLPEVSDDELFNYMYYYYSGGQEVKHVYYLTIDGLDDGGSYEKLKNAQAIRNQLLKDGLSVKNFETYVGTYCSDEELINRGGANGWDIDMDEMSDAYQSAVTATEVGSLSPVFKDDSGYSFVFIDRAYQLPDVSNEDPETMDRNAYLSDIDDSLLPYFRDNAAYLYWQDDCQTYMSNLYDNANVILYPMPAGLSYDADMTSVSSDGDQEEASAEK